MNYFKILIGTLYNIIRHLVSWIVTSGRLVITFTGDHTAFTPIICRPRPTSRWIPLSAGVFINNALCGFRSLLTIRSRTLVVRRGRMSYWLKPALCWPVLTRQGWSLGTVGPIGVLRIGVQLMLTSEILLTFIKLLTPRGCCLRVVGCLARCYPGPQLQKLFTNRGLQFLRSKQNQSRININ